MAKYKTIHIIFGPLLFLLLLPGCKKEIVPKAFYPRSAHEAYQHALEEANLLETALGRDWTLAGEEALEKPVSIALPYEEAFYWDPKSADAGGYRFFVKRGIRVEMEISGYSSDSLLLFADLFRETGDTIIYRTHVATADEKMHRLEFEPRRDSYYALRLQPELLRGGQFRVVIREVPSIGFPVKGKTSRSISSFFGGLTGLFVGSLAAIIISEPTKGIPVIRGVSVFMTFLGFFITLISLAKFGEEL